ALGGGGAAAAFEWSAWVAVRLCWLAGLFALLRFVRLGPRDVGWHAAALRAALPMVAALWGAAIVAHDLCSWWFEFPDRYVGGRLSWSLAITDTLGTALAEETVFRGFLLVQIVARLRARGWGTLAAGVWGGCATTLLFVLCHVPVLLSADPQVDHTVWLRSVAIGGVLLAWVFLTTGNLWWCVAAHGFVNTWANGVVGAPYEHLPIAPLLVVGATIGGARWLRPPAAVSPPSTAPAAPPPSRDSRV
ncbi:MAG: hypothetical protein RL398_3016, partial [Planctomycetota bacterium]